MGRLFVSQVNDSASEADDLDIPGMERGFKVVKFDEMYNGEGLMPWVMSGVYIPSIGIVGRWRDRTEPVGEGVEGNAVFLPYSPQLIDQDLIAYGGIEFKISGTRKKR